MSEPPHVLAMGGWDREDEGVAFEKHVARRLLTLLGLQRIARAAPGGKITTMKGFNRMFPTFPAKLDTLCTRASKKITLLRMLTTPLKQAPVAKFYDLLGETDDGDYAALFVRVDGFTDGLAFHNCVDLSRQTTQLIVRPPGAVAFCVEAVPKFVRYVVKRTDWSYTPEE